MLQTAARILVVLVLLAGMAMAVRMAIADVYARRAAADGLERAVAWEPGNADYHRWLGVALLARDPKRSGSEFREAIRLNRWDADSRMRLALLHESQGRVADAERELLETTRIDVTFLPRWALANLEFRRNKMAEFWTWARAAVPMSYGDRTPLFDLAAATGQKNIADRLGVKQDEVWASYLGWDLGKGPAEEIGVAALHVARGRHPDMQLLSQACGRLMDLGAVEAALRVWNAGVKSGVFLAGEAARGRVTNPKFIVAPGESGFDWVVNPPNGGFAAKDALGGLRIHFSGDQSERCSVLTQRIAVSPGASYRVRVKFRAMEMNRNSGLHWAVSARKAQLAEGGIAGLSFRVPGGVELVNLALEYRRPQGEVRMEGTILLDEVEMEEDNPGALRLNPVWFNRRGGKEDGLDYRRGQARRARYCAPPGGGRLRGSDSL